MCPRRGQESLEQGPTVIGFEDAKSLQAVLRHTQTHLLETSRRSPITKRHRDKTYREPWRKGEPQSIAAATDLETSLRFRI